MTTTNRPAEVSAAHEVLYRLNGVRSGMERIAYCLGTLRRPDAQGLVIGVDWALEQGLVKVEGSKANYGRWSETDFVLYLTKAGKAWLRAFPGHDFGASVLYAEKRAALWAGVAKRNAEIAAAATVAA